MSMSERAWQVVEVWKGLGAVSSIGREWCRVAVVWSVLWCTAERMTGSRAVGGLKSLWKTYRGRDG